MRSSSFMDFVRNNHRRIIWWAVFVIGAVVISCSIYLWLKPFDAGDDTVFNKIKKITKTEQAEVVNKDFGLLIPKISANLPVVTDVDGSKEDEYLTALQNGVAHYKGTDKPDSKGNIFIFGHSSDWRWHKGDYKTAFKRLPELEKDDEILVWYKQKEYKYKVSEKEIVEPSDISWLNQTSDSVLTLMTCYPIGTDKQRMIIRAKPI